MGSARCAPRELCGKAPARHVEEALIAVRPDDKGIGRTGLAITQTGQLVRHTVVQRVILDLQIDALFPRFLTEVTDGFHVLPQALVGNARVDQDRAAEQACDVALPPLETAVPTAPRDPDRVAQLAAQWGLGGSVRRLTEALATA